MDDKILIEKIERATIAAEKLTTWLTVANQFRESLKRQSELQAQVERVRNEIAYSEQAAGAIQVNAVSPDEALANLAGTVVAQKIIETLGDVSAGKPADEEALSGLFSDDSPSSDVALTEVFKLPETSTTPPTEPNTDAIDSLLSPDNAVWARNLDSLSAAPDETDDADLELLFNDLTEAPDSPWADTWDDTMFDVPAADIVADDTPVDAGEAAPEVPPPAQPEKKRGVLQQLFFRN